MTRGRRRFALRAVAPLILVAVAVGVLTRDWDSTNHPVLGAVFPAQPVPGENVSLRQATAATSLPIPLLPRADIPDPCGSETVRLSVAAVWASPSDHGSTKPSPVGINYTSGVWESVFSIHGYDRDALTKDGDLRPVEQAFSRD